MSYNTGIEWADTTWNPVTGCTPFSLGCMHCYAKSLARKLKSAKNPRYVNGFNVTKHHDLLELPFIWKKPRLVFVNSMSDIYHDEVSSDFITLMFLVMRHANHHIYQLLTKRAERMAMLAPKLPWADNIWQGATIEHPDYLHRMDCLKRTPAKVKFLSLEPLLGPMSNLDLAGIDWVIVGGESGPQARPIEKKWVLDIRDQCLEQQVPFFFKQWGGVNKKKAGNLLEGRKWNEMPNILNKVK